MPRSFVLCLVATALFSPLCSNGEDTLSLSLAAWEPALLPCPALGPGTERGLHESGSVLSVWVSPVGQMVLPASHSIDHEKYDACAEGREELLDEDKPLNGKLLLFDEEDHLAVLPNGSLRIDHFGWADRGDFRCLLLGLNGSYPEPLVTWESPPAATLNLDSEYRWHVYYFSIVCGVCTAAGFMILTLLIKMVCFLLETYGCCLCCCCCKNQLPPKARKMKAALDSIETYRQQQQDKLRENYTQQSDWIRQNCALQMERVRDNYQSQSQNIKDLKQYGSAQIGAVREQYFEQMQRIRDYSTGQLDRVHENYIFQRQRLRKFSAQNYLKMRETGKYTTKTLSKVMESLPPLYLDLSNCRATGDDAEMDFPDFPPIAELDPIDEEGKFELGVADFLQGRFREASAEEGGSLYFTPSGTPARESMPPVPQLVARSQRNLLKSSSLKSTPTRERNPADAYKSVYACRHKKSSSFSHFLPSKWFAAPEPAPAAPVAAPLPRNQHHVRAVIEHVNRSCDYIDISSSEATMASSSSGTASTSVPGGSEREPCGSEREAAPLLPGGSDTLTAVVTEVEGGRSEARVTLGGDSEKPVGAEKSLGAEAVDESTRMLDGSRLHEEV